MTLCPTPKSGSFEGIYYLAKWDLSGKGRYYRLYSASYPIDIVKQAISDVDKGLPIKLPDLSLAGQIEREEKGIVSDATIPIITSITLDNDKTGTKTLVSIVGSGFL